jgi:hypothetical protein
MNSHVWAVIAMIGVAFGTAVVGAYLGLCALGRVVTT